MMSRTPSGTANDNDSPTVVDLEASASLALVKTGVLQDDAMALRA